ncbi:MAG: hypothetical protein R3B74_08725 [Nitrospirales bacterium]|nr:hypothetical protein [Nitrospirales bacterium]
MNSRTAYYKEQYMFGVGGISLIKWGAVLVLLALVIVGTVLFVVAWWRYIRLASGGSLGRASHPDERQHYYGLLSRSNGTAIAASRGTASWCSLVQVGSRRLRAWLAGACNAP